MKNKTEELKQQIRKICTNYGEEVEAYGIGTISYALTEEQFAKLFDYIKKNFVPKDEVRKVIKLCEYRPKDFNKSNGLYQSVYRDWETT